MNLRRSQVIFTLGLFSSLEKLKFFLNVLFRVVIVAFDVVGLLMVGLLVAIVSGEDFAQNFGVEVPQPLEENAVILLALVAVFFSLKSVGSAFLMWDLARILSLIEVRVSFSIARYLFLGPPDRLKRYSPGEIFWTAGGSTTALVTQSVSSVANIVGDLALLIAIVGVFFLVDPVLSLTTFAYFGAMSFFYFLAIGRKVKILNRETATSSAESSGLLQMLLGVFKELFVSGNSDYFLDKYESARLRMARAYAGVTFINSLPRLVLETAMFLGLAILFAFLRPGETGTVTLVNISIVLVGSVCIVAALIPLQRSFTDLRGFHAQAQESKDLLGSFDFSQLFSKETAVSMPNTSEPAGIVVAGVTYTYPDSAEPALIDISLEIAAGEFCAVIGPSGAGKSSLVDVILGFAKPDRGIACIEGVDSQKFIAENPGRVGYVPQRPGMVPGSIRDNIALGDFSENADRVRRAIELAGLADVVDALPYGVDSPMGKHFDGFSGGQLQRLALARSVYSAPGVVILDEATSALDLKTEAEVFSQIILNVTGVTRVVIAHRLSTIQHADKVILMEGGRLLDIGTFTELRLRSRRLRDLIRLNELI